MVNSPIYPHELTGRTIRLLTVEPGDPETPLHCNLTETCLDTTPSSYYALSYCWGANHSPVQITCNSHPLLVTPNLHSVLLEYRRRATRIPLWVDAICIDQSNITERTSQVRMMDQIYSEAECVIVWLGEAEATDEMALWVLKELHLPWADSTGIPVIETGERALVLDGYYATNVPQAYWDALAAFLLRPWFSRIWIVQELLLARQVSIWCGSRTIDDFPVLETAARLSQYISCHSFVQAGLKAMTWKDEHAQQAAEKRLANAHVLFMIKYAREHAMSGTLYLFTATRYFDATDRRDKIFALVSLTSDIDRSFVDYSKSYEEVIKELNLMFLDGRIGSMGCVLDIWSFITRAEEEDITQPSWMVDLLKVLDSKYTAMMTAYATYEKPMIERTPELQFVERDGKEVIDIRGTVFDTITHTIRFPILKDMSDGTQPSVEAQWAHEYLDWVQRVTNLIASSGDLTTPSYGSEPSNIYQPSGYIYDAFWRTLCCNRQAVEPIDPPPDSFSYESFLNLLRLTRWRYETRFRKWWYLGIAMAPYSALVYFLRRNKLLLSATLLALPTVVRLCNRTWESFWYGVRGYFEAQQKDFQIMHIQWTMGREFGLTRLGMIGMLPISAKVGDSVGFFAGNRVPFVLRRSEGGYKIVGDAYLHGVMNGEGEKSEGEMLTIV